MGEYLMDLAIVTILVVGITALMGVITNGIGENVFGRKNRTQFTDQASKFVSGWKEIGGKK
ncbi:hypothetical protein D1B31_00665 [Neobacillus notoginsengisoli]|uniref:Uncharacterized protein n=1 Tax=Neobacillus notoginsengisoli TaxID=1578198 RepID=A0A417YZ84_9BACI|nr:hypothetical protein [Neobacillus notoginsengisoli]RHW43223.1 hypothetical protein D1B31_00665 [Neobacillus notoginsengisoli]